MGTRDEKVGEVLKRIDGLVILNEWQLTLAKDLRTVAEGLSDCGQNPPAPDSGERGSDRAV